MGVKLPLFANQTKGVRFLGREKETRERKTAKGRSPFRDSLDTQSKSSVKRSGEARFGEAVFGSGSARNPTDIFFSFLKSGARRRRAAPNVVRVIS